VTRVTPTQQTAAVQEDTSAHPSPVPLSQFQADCLEAVEAQHADAKCWPPSRAEIVATCTAVAAGYGLVTV
jgi:hypothetical protein